MTPSRQARIQAGYTLDQAARLVRVTPRYLGRLESSSRFPYHIACRLSGAYRCRLECFLPQPGERPPRKPRGRTGTRSRGV